MRGRTRRRGFLDVGEEVCRVEERGGGGEISPVRTLAGCLRIDIGAEQID